MIPRRMILLATLLAVALVLPCCMRGQAAPTPTAPLAPVQPQPAPTVAIDTPPAVAAPTVDVPDAAVIYRVGLVTDGGRVDDGSMNQGVYQGMLRAGEQLAVETNFIETVQPGDFEKNIKTFVDAGYDMVVTVGPLLGETTRAMAELYPQVSFVAVDVAYDAAPDNLVGLAFREDQMGFLAGALAGLISDSQTVGVVAGMDTPATRRLRSGYENGVRHGCAECTVVAITLDSSTDPARGRTAALRQTAEGADVIFGVGGPTGSGAVLGAAQQGVWAIGADQDEFYTTFRGGAAAGSDKIVSSAMKRADEAVYQVIKNAVMGSFRSGTALFDAANNGVGLADFHLAADAVPADVRAKIAEIYQRLASGQLDTGVDPVTGDQLQ